MSPPAPHGPLNLGDFPTPLERISFRSRDGGETAMWVKNDGLSSSLYGGNKVRKLREVLARALRAGKRRVVTFGAAGSHHVLATTLFAKRVGLSTAAILTPQPHTEHAADTLRAALGAGLQAVPVSSAAQVPLALAKLVSRGDLLLGPGALGVVGARAYSDAVTEIVDQLASGGHEAPVKWVVAVGSGGTAAGLLAGLYLHELPGKVVGVCSSGSAASRGLVLSQAAMVLRSVGERVDPLRLHAALQLDRTQTGAGYGHPGPGSGRARDVARAVGLRLDPTYTEKAFAVAIALAELEDFQDERKVGLGVGSRTLYWHTLSAAPMGPLLTGAPVLSDLPMAVRELLDMPRPGAAR